MGPLADLQRFQAEGDGRGGGGLEIIFSRCLYVTVVLKQREQLVKYYYLAVQITGVFIDPLLSPTSPLAEWSVINCVSYHWLSRIPYY